MPGPTTVADLAAQILAAVVGFYATEGIDPPRSEDGTAVSYLSSHDPIPECGSLIVSYTGVYPGQPAPPQGQPPFPVEQITSAMMFHAEFRVWAFRCTGVPVSPQDMLGINETAETAEATLVMTDAWMLPHAVVTARSAGSIGVDYATQVLLGPATPIDPAGGIGGTVMPVYVMLQ